ncbi:hypothetical protein [Sporolactobacillus shoreicorticis]|uniref:Uncharacterized protein n=1 Tax=Sporolactobacillus shoreicorticis TaxID=1923877 RepID=A0ABW5S6R2_9BACL|nr:hypothetical protein [Sporolactobacillus shoreicorticis]
MDDRNWTLNQALEADYWELMELYSAEYADDYMSVADFAKII